DTSRSTATATAAIAARTSSLRSKGDRLGWRVVSPTRRWTEVLPSPLTRDAIPPTYRETLSFTQLIRTLARRRPEPLRPSIARERGRPEAAIAKDAAQERSILERLRRCAMKEG